jgi:putative spermidine/putrescine transport system ATP-binding protein
MSDLELRGISKTFGDTVAVDDLSFRIEPGEFVSILGPSGCGKTTTLRLIAGFERPDTGRILIDGQDLTSVPPQRRNIGVVFQSYALFPHMTVAQNVAFGLEMRRMARADVQSAVADVLALVRLGELAGRYPNQLSGGQQQRVALARSLAIRPRLLLLDEPLSNLDAKLRDDMREEIRRIQREVGITAVFVTHDQSEAFVLADRVAVMDRGRLQQIADPVSIYEKPANATVGSFIGQANVWIGTALAVNADRVRVKLAGGADILATGTGLTRGRACKVFIKHERIVLTRAQPAHADNWFVGRVTGRTYLGDSTSYAVVLAGDLSLKGVVPNRSSFEHFDMGDEVFAAWAATESLVFSA